MSALLKKISYTALMSLLLSLFFFASPTYAKTCKGLSKSACSSSNSCTWVKGYTTKKGNNIKAYCRNKGKKSASSKSKSRVVEKNSETNRLKSKSDKAKNAPEKFEKKAKSSKKGNKLSKSKNTKDKAKKASKKTKKKAEKNKNKLTQTKKKKAKKDKNLTQKKDKQ